MFHYDEQGGEAKAVGWISMSDMFMLCSIVMLAVAVGFAISLRKTDVQLTSVEGDYAKYRNVNTLNIDELKSKVTQSAIEAANFRAQIAALDLRVDSLKNQLGESDKQLAHFQTESSRFKTQSEGLTSELSIRTTKLNAVQTEFDTYRNINTLTVGDLKSELINLSKESVAYKATVASLNVQISALQAKLAASDKQSANLTLDRDQYKTNSERLAANLADQKLKAQGELAKVNGDLTQLAADLARATQDLAKANGESTKTASAKELLLSDLNKWKANYAVLQAEDKELKLKLSVIDTERGRLEGKLADLQGTIVGLTGEIGELKPQINKLKIDLSGAKLRIIDLEKAVFESINRASLVVTITAQDVPRDFTLELFVTDPLSNECGPFSSVVFNDGDEIGVLQQSVDFKSGREGSQKAVFYSLRPIDARSEPGHVYTVKAMIRHNGNNEGVQLPHNVTVTCNIDLPLAVGPNAHRIAKLDITSPGYIKKVRRNGPLNASTPFKNMWPWEPVYHFQRTICDFQIDGNAITNLQNYDNLPTVPSGRIQAYVPTGREVPEQRIESIRTRNTP